MEEGQIKIKKVIYKRRECELCGELATIQLTFLLPNARSNPASNGYGKDDISWCSDAKAFVCGKHEKEKYQMADNLGMSWCANFIYGDRFKHLFLYEKLIEEKISDEEKQNGKGKIR